MLSVASLMPDVSVAILGWNSLGHLKECLPSLRRQTQRPFELIVVDNGSTDGTVEYLTGHHPDVIVIRNETNRGFCEAANQAVREAHVDLVLLLNADVVLHEHCLASLSQAWATAGPEVLALFPKVLWYDARDRINTFGARWDKWKLWVDVGRGEPADCNDGSTRTFGSYFVAPCFRRDALSAIGNFDESFFAMAEDFDVCYRANVMGYQLRLCPGALVYHKEHGSKDDNRVSELTFLSRLGVRNLLIVLLKNYQARNLFLFFPWVMVTKWARSLVGSVARNGVHSIFRSVAVYLGVLVDLLWGSPAIWRKRRAIQRRRVMTDSEIWQL